MHSPALHHPLSAPPPSIPMYPLQHHHRRLHRVAQTNTRAHLCSCHRYLPQCAESRTALCRRLFRQWNRHTCGQLTRTLQIDRLLSLLQEPTHLTAHEGHEDEKSSAGPEMRDAQSCRGQEEAFGAPEGAVRNVVGDLKIFNLPDTLLRGLPIESELSTKS